MTAQPKFGDTIVNDVASDENPHKTGIFVRAIRRTGRLNPGVWWQITDGRGSFWESPPAICRVVNATTGVLKKEKGIRLSTLDSPVRESP